ncbi:MAG: universal stress protein, partial [Bacteroidota bacterium]
LQRYFDAGLQMIWVKTPHSVSNEEDLIGEMIDSMRRHGFKKFKVNTRRSFSPAQGILTFTTEVKASLIAMPTHGRKGLLQLFFDSVTEDVVNQSLIPVWSFNNGAALANPKIDQKSVGSTSEEIKVK